MLCRTENFVDGHTGFNHLLRGEKLLGLLNDLAGEPMLLFKEKINYKLSGSGMFPRVSSFYVYDRGVSDTSRRLCPSH